MNEFQKKYIYAMERMKIPKADINVIMDTDRHRRFLRKMRARAVYTIMALVVLSFCFSVLGVSAAKWIQRHAAITETGFTIDSRPYDGMEGQIKEGTVAHNYENYGENIGENIGESIEENLGESIEENIEENMGESIEENIEENMGETVYKYENHGENMEGTTLPTGMEETGKVEERSPEFFEIYTSWEDAQEYIDFPIAYPNVTEYDSLQIAVQKEEGGLHLAEAIYTTETGELTICYTSYVDTAGWDICHEYNGVISNEREYQNADGYKISLVDNYADNYNEVIGEKHVFAVIAFDWYEIEFDFSGYEDTQIYQLLDGMDFSVYQE